MPTVLLQNPYKGKPVPVGGGTVTLMGVINRSPESANRDTYAADPADALAMAQRYGEQGAQVIDVGGQSTNYQNPRLDAGQEIDRVAPTVQALAGQGWVVSVDTFSTQTATAAVEAGAALINDTSGMQQPGMARLAAESQVPIVLMYIEGKTPLEVAEYDDARRKHERIAQRLDEQLAQARSEGIESVILDPGTGIPYRSDYERYTMTQFEIAEHLQALTNLSAPVLYAVPRKPDPHRTVALATLAIASGASMLRIHDVEKIADIARLMRRLPGRQRQKP